MSIVSKIVGLYIGDMLVRLPYMKPLLIHQFGWQWEYRYGMGINTSFLTFLKRMHSLCCRDRSKKGMCWIFYRIYTCDIKVRVIIVREKDQTLSEFSSSLSSDDLHRMSKTKNIDLYRC